MALTLRLTKGSALTHQELDDNFEFLSGSIGDSNVLLSGSFDPDRLILSADSGSQEAGGVTTSNQLRTYDGNTSILIGGSQGNFGVTGLGMLIKEDEGSGDHVILSDGEDSNLRFRAGGGDVGNTYVMIQADQAGFAEEDIFTVAQFGGPKKGTELFHSGSLVFFTDELSGDKSVYVSGSLSGSKDVYFPALPNTTTPHIVGFDSTTGQLTYYSTSSFATGGGGIALTDLSVTLGAASESGSLSYDNGTGVFTFNPADLSGLGGGGSSFDVSAAADGEILFRTSATSADGKHVKQYYANGSYGKGLTIGSTHSSNAGLSIYETSNDPQGYSEDHIILSDSSGSDLIIRNGGKDAGDGYIFFKVDEPGLFGTAFNVAKLGGPDKSVHLYHSGSNVFRTEYIGSEASIIISGSISGSNDVFFSGLPNTSKPHIVGYDTATGQFTYYSTGSFGSGGGSTDYVSDVILNGTTLEFTGVGSAFGSGVDLSTLAGGSTDITALNNFTGSAQTSLDALNAASSSYLTGADTGSFVYSGSFDGASSVVTLYSKDLNYDLDLSGLAGGGGGFSITASNEGSDLTNSMSKIDFVGNAVEATNVGSIVTVTVNTGSAPTPTDISALNLFTGSIQTEVNSLTAATSSYLTGADTGSFVYSGSFDGSTTLTLYSEDNNYSLDLSALAGGGTPTDITALNNFTGSIQTEVDSLTAATSSYLVASDTGSFYVSSSVSNDTITFTQGDGTTEEVIVDNVQNTTSASYAATASYAYETDVTYATDLTSQTTARVVHVAGTANAVNGTSSTTSPVMSVLSGKTLGTDAFFTATWLDNQNAGAQSRPIAIETISGNNQLVFTVDTMNADVTDAIMFQGVVLV